jgi:hypothetical protein
MNIGHMGVGLITPGGHPLREGSEGHGVPREKPDNRLNGVPKAAQGTQRGLDKKPKLRGPASVPPAGA